MMYDIYKATPSGDVYLGLKAFEIIPSKGDTVFFGVHEYKVLDSTEYYLRVKLIN